MSKVFYSRIRNMILWKDLKFKKFRRQKNDKPVGKPKKWLYKTITIMSNFWGEKSPGRNKILLRYVI